MLTCCSHDACLDRGGHHDALERGHPRPIAEPTGQSTGGVVALGVVQHLYELMSRKPKEMNRQDSVAIQLGAFPSPGTFGGTDSVIIAVAAARLGAGNRERAAELGGESGCRLTGRRQGVRRVHQARLWAVVRAASATPSRKDRRGPDSGPWVPWN